QQQQAEEEMEGRGGMGDGEERLPSPFHDRPSTSRAAVPPRPPRRREQVGGGGGAMLEKFQAGDLAEALPPAVMNGRRGGDKSHHLATPAGRPPLHHHHQHAAPIRFLPKGEADELMMALEGGASNRPNYDDNALVMDDRMDYYLNVVMAKRGPFAREPNRGKRQWMPDMGASVKMEIDEEAPSSSGLNELRPTVEDEVRAARERRHAEHQQQLAAQQQEELVVGEVNDQERQWIEMFQKMSMTSQRNVLGHLVEGAEPLVVRFLQRVIEPHFQRDFISCLPAEISLKILEKLPPNSLCSIQRVCSRWASLGDDDNLWKKKCTSEYLEWLPAPTKRENGLWAQQPGHVAARSVLVPGMMSEEDFIRHRAERAGDVYGSIWMKSPHKALFLRLQRIYSNWKRRRIAGTCIFKGHDDHVITCLQLTPEMIVTGSDDNTLKVWTINEPTIEHGINDERTSHLKHILVGHSGGVWTSQVSSDGKYIVSGSTDRTVRVWSSETGKQLHCLGGHTSTVRCMALHGTTLVSGSRDTTLRVWDIESGQCLQHLIGHVAAVRCVQFNGVKVASGAYDFTVKIWNAATGECVHTLQGHTNRVYSLLMDTERDVVVSGSLDTTIRVWNMTSGLCIANLVGHTSLTSGMQLRGDILVSCNADSYIRVWNIRDNQCIHRLGGNHNGHQSAITSLQFLDNGLVATSSDDGTVKLWDVTRGCFVRDLVKLSSGGSGGCIWRLKASDTLLVCAVGSRNGTEETKLILLDFDASFP
ncbi:sel-10, partial [Pristionchus pacificus]